jgi:DNA (cytosine-5)-methyltransferase 1
MTYTYISLFAGVGGFDIGAERAGWDCLAQVEWDGDAQHVLRHHWPHIPKYADVRDYNGAQHPADIIVGGFPCQDVSLAGHRKGVLDDDTRSNLYTEIIRIVKEMRDATDGAQPRWVVLENVRGLLSVDEGDGFARVQDDLAHCGAVAIEWALLDSQFFGIPQRRQRVFIAACFDLATIDRSPDPLFPVAARVPGDHRQGIAEREVVTALTATGTGIGGPDAAHAQAGHLIPVRAVDAVSLAENQRGELRTSDVMPNITTGGGKPGQSYPTVITFAMQPDDHGTTTGALRIVETDIAPTIAAADGAKTYDRGLRVAEGLAVRRITPLEAERLQGWPDNWTLHGKAGHHQTDTKRYQQIGNGISAPVAEWVARRINMAEIPPNVAET